MVAVLVLLPGTGSDGLLAVTVAVFVIAWKPIGPVIESVAVPPTARLPIVHTPDALSYVVPADATTIGGRKNPGGNGSLTTTPVAASGPRFVAVTTQVPSLNAPGSVGG